jgi:hypothetical protein
MKSLWFVSSFFLIFTSCSNFICKNPQIGNTADQRVVAGLFDTVNVIKFKSKISYKTSEISGILILKKIDESTLAGGFINEFGINIFDITITENYAKLGYVFKNIDKWYIRRTLETNLHFMFSKPKLLATCSISDTSVYVATVSRSLHYVYYLSNEKLSERADMYKRASKIATMQRYTKDMAEVVLQLKYTNGTMGFEFYEIND